MPHCMERQHEQRAIPANLLEPWLVVETLRNGSHDCFDKLLNHCSGLSICRLLTNTLVVVELLGLLVASGVNLFHHVLNIRLQISNTSCRKSLLQRLIEAFYLPTWVG